MKKLLKSLWKIFNIEIFNLKDFYFFTITFLTGLNKKPTVYKKTYAPPDVINYKDQVNPTKINLLKKPPQEVKKGRVKLKTRTHKRRLKLRVRKIHTEKNFFHGVKWVFQDLKFSSATRNYNIELPTKINKKTYQDIHLPRKARTIRIKHADIEVKRKLKITEEIVEIIPYTHSLKTGRLFRLPIIKKPIAKSRFSIDQTERIKDEMAKQSKTRKANLEIITIYDKFNFKLYSEIIPHEKKSIIACYPSNKKIDLSKDDMYYLILGRKINTGKLVKTLIKMFPETDT